MKVYQSKVDWWLMLIVFGALAFPVVMGIVEKDYLISLAFLGITGGVAWLLFSIRYKIIGEQLVVMNIKVDIHTIRKIYKTRNPLSAPALSLNRIAIVYNRYDEILISPKAQEDFIKELLKVNPAIVVEV